MAVEAFLGVSDWNAPDWQTTFYPTELPEEWRVAYYGSHFSCVWLDHATWASLSIELTQFWLGETPERFRFVLEASKRSEQAAENPFDILRPGISVVCAEDAPSVFWFDAATDMRQFASSLARANETDGEIYLISRDGNLSRIEEVKALLLLLGL